MLAGKMKKILEKVPNDEEIYLFDAAEQQIHKVNNLQYRETIKWRSVGGFEQFTLCGDTEQPTGTHWVIF